MNLTEVEFPSLIIALIANISLIIIVLRYAPQNASRILFVLFGLSQTVWIAINYFAVRSSPDRILDMARWTVASAVPHPLLFYLFIKSFLNKNYSFKRSSLLLAIILVLFFVLLAKSPFLFTHTEIKDGLTVPLAGPGMASFGVYAFTLVILAFIHLFRSWWKAKGIERAQWRTIGTGLLITFFLVLSLNFLLAVIADEIKYINFGHIYTLPFVMFTAYAMVKHHLLNIRVIVAEATVVILNLILLIQFLSSETFGQFFVSGIVFTGTVIVGILLVRGVRKEVEQREQLEILTVKLKAANERLKILDRARSEFITMASHQLRTPPATIKWYLAAILAGDFGQLNPELKEAILKANLTNNSLISLIDDMLNVSRIERGKMEFVFEKANLEELAQSTVNQLTPLAATKNLKLTYHKSKVKLPLLVMDKEKISQVINNLIDNAIKYTKKGQITVDLEKTATHLMLKVRDTGKGVSQQEVVNIFQKFGRGKDSQKYSTGLGLGLYVANIVIEQHNGKIWVESKGQGQGSTFIFTLPIKSNLKSNKALLDLTKQLRPS